MELWQLISRLKELSDFFCKNGVRDIYTNSKIYEVLMANQLGHQIIDGHAYSPDARDEEGNLYEYKHYKESSSNHTWTFNDFTCRTIKKLCDVKSVYFAVIDDKYVIPKIGKIYIVPGREVAKYMEIKTQNIVNKRKMINISARQITDSMQYDIMMSHDIETRHRVQLPFETLYFTMLEEIFITARKIEEIIDVDGILTSNKLWELLVACKLNHKINPEQKKHDAYDINNRTYEYKVSVAPRWDFQDISENVLASYRNDEKIILAIVDKRAFVVRCIAACQPEAIIRILKDKLANKKKSPTEVRRLTAHIGPRDVNAMIEEGDAEWIL